MLGGREREHAEPLRGLVVGGGDFAAVRDELVEALELDEADGGVGLAQAPVGAEPGVEVAGEAGLALVAVDPRLVGDGLVVGDDHAAFAGGHDLRRVEGVGGGDAPVGGVAAVERGAVRVGGVAHEEEAARLAVPASSRGSSGRDDAADVDDDDAGRLLA